MVEARSLGTTANIHFPLKSQIILKRNLHDLKISRPAGPKLPSLWLAELLSFLLRRNNTTVDNPHFTLTPAEAAAKLISCA